MSVVPMVSNIVLHSCCCLTSFLQVTVSETSVVPMVSYSVLWCLLLSHCFCSVRGITAKASVTPIVSYSVLRCLLVLLSHLFFPASKVPKVFMLPMVFYCVLCYSFCTVCGAYGVHCVLQRLMPVFVQVSIVVRLPFLSS